MKSDLYLNIEKFDKSAYNSINIMYLHGLNLSLIETFHKLKVNTLVGYYPFELGTNLNLRKVSYHFIPTRLFLQNLKSLVLQPYSKQLKISSLSWIVLVLRLNGDMMSSLPWKLVTWRLLRNWLLWRKCYVKKRKQCKRWKRSWWRYGNVLDITLLIFLP